MPALPSLMVAPNGARHGKPDHPALPVTLPEILRTARACQAAGADGLHLHLRDGEGRHLLDAGAYSEALAALAEDAPGLAVQVTTEAAGRYDPAHQRKVALDCGAALISASVREMVAGGEEGAARRFYAQCRERGIGLQHILYAPADLALLRSLLPAPAFEDPALQLLLVLGRYGPGNEAGPGALLPYMAAMRKTGIRPDWAACAFGQRETACLRAAHDAGGKLRVGFENSFWNADGSRAADNAERVAEVRAALALPA